MEQMLLIEQVKNKDWGLTIGFRTQRSFMTLTRVLSTPSGENETCLEVGRECEERTWGL